MPLQKAFEAGKGGKTCAEWDTTRLLGRKMPEILRRGCPEVAQERHQSGPEVAPKQVLT